MCKKTPRRETRFDRLDRGTRHEDLCCPENQAERCSKIDYKSQKSACRINTRPTTIIVLRVVCGFPGAAKRFSLPFKPSSYAKAFSSIGAQATPTRTARHQTLTMQVHHQRPHNLTAKCFYSDCKRALIACRYPLQSAAKGGSCQSPSQRPSQFR